MRVSASAIGRILVALLALLFVLYVWPTPYREYNPPEQFREWIMKVRVNRITGSQQFLMFGEGWEKPEAVSTQKDTTTSAIDSALNQIRTGKR